MYLGTHYGARASAAISQHIHVELALADFASIVIQALHMRSIKEASRLAKARHI